jgi:phage shock protein A
MGATTTADRLIKDMEEKIQEALKATNEAFCEICVKGTWGADQYTDEYKQKLTDAQSTLAALKMKLG